MWKDGKSLIFYIPCMFCKHKIRGEHKHKKICMAFPDNIPEKILTGELSHLQHVEGDRGIKYEPIDEETDYRKIFNQ
ncbi:hypothetical protein [Anaerophilus nitritogenes]|uniref:hypothetical protein n=1 Tax=Anaerophilus nitritogenes TaxID=2498136 RepID=UPI001931109F|nr:hypothetical protein [Anaerophilus nitritogenes]